MSVKSFAILPAAGTSRRMRGGHKLLLPWPSGDDHKVIDATILNWLASRVERVVIILRHDAEELRERTNRYPIDPVLANPPPEDMKHSIQLGLRYLEMHFAPKPKDRVLVAPADFPTLGTSLIDEVVVAGGDCSGIVAPRFCGPQADATEDDSSGVVMGGHCKPGHPINLPWSMSEQVFSLPKNRGLDLLLEGHVRWLDYPYERKPMDIDTQEAYRAEVKRISR